MRAVVKLAFHILEDRRVAEASVETRLLGLDEVVRFLGFERDTTFRDRTQLVVEVLPVGFLHLEARHRITNDRTAVQHATTSNMQFRSALNRDERAIRNV